MALRQFCIFQFSAVIALWSFVTGSDFRQFRYFYPREKPRFAASPIMVLMAAWLRRELLNYLKLLMKNQPFIAMPRPLSLRHTGNHGSCVINYDYREKCPAEGTGHCWTITEIRGTIFLRLLHVVSKASFVETILLNGPSVSLSSF